VVEKIKVDRGYETALGAALGDDLDLPLDPAPPRIGPGSQAPEMIRHCPKV
jgi:hypothetical protein